MCQRVMRVFACDHIFYEEVTMCSLRKSCDSQEQIEEIRIDRGCVQCRAYWYNRIDDPQAKMWLLSMGQPELEREEGQ